MNKTISSSMVDFEWPCAQFELVARVVEPTPAEIESSDSWTTSCRQRGWSQTWYQTVAVVFARDPRAARISEVGARFCVASPSGGEFHWVEVGNLLAGVDVAATDLSVALDLLDLASPVLLASPCEAR